MSAGRVAIYYAPEDDSDLAAFAHSWLGLGSAPPGFTPFAPADWTAIVQSPRHYGFHATLKPPFPLRDGVLWQDVATAAERFASARKPFPLPELQLSTLSSFLALTAVSPSSELSELAASCVREFEPFRRPPTTAELDARRQGVRNARQLEHIEKWGYPYVFDEWQFHMTLTSSLRDEAQRTQVELLLQPRLATLLRSPLTVDSICVFLQDDRQEPFRMVTRARFGS